MTRGWPARLSSRGVTLRPLALSDRRAWQDARRRNAAWLGEWDATAPPGSDGRPGTYGAMVRGMLRGAKQGRQLPFVIEYDDRLVGQITVNNVIRGSAQFASIGYWIDQRYAGRGITPRAVALTVDHCFGPVGLHRIEIAIRPENVASLRVVDKLGIAQIGYAPRFLHINGAWRDHLLFAVTAEDVPDGLLARLDAQVDAQVDAQGDGRRGDASEPESHQSQQ